MGPAAMIPEIDIWRSAQLMIRQYGDAAVSEADARVTALTEQGDSAGGLVGGASANLSTSYRTTRRSIPLTRQRNPMSRHLRFCCDATIY